MRRDARAGTAQHRLSSEATPRAAAPNSGKAVVPELDVLRGLAALLMVLNHAGFRLLSANDATESASAIGVFLGSFAPVVFFFATGFGIALSGTASARRLDLVGLLWKPLLLVLADQFFFWRAGVNWGIDFFSFIAISTVSVTLLARLRRPTLICVMLILLLLGLRYALGPALRPQIHGTGLLEWVIGVTAIPNVSYPLSPWLVYPLLGFVLGRHYAGVHLLEARVRRRWLGAGAGLLLAASGASLVLAHLDAGFFRWGMVSAAFFVLSIVVLAAVAWLSRLLARSWPSVADALSLRGVASFMVIPIHYALLDVCTAAFVPPLNQASFVALAAGIAVISFFLASHFSVRVAAALPGLNRRGSVTALLVALAVASLVSLLPVAMHEPAVGAVLALAGQTLVAILLGLRWPFALPHRSVH